MKRRSTSSRFLVPSSRSTVSGVLVLCLLLAGCADLDAGPDGRAAPAELRAVTVSGIAPTREVPARVTLCNGDPCELRITLARPGGGRTPVGLYTAHDGYLWYPEGDEVVAECFAAAPDSTTRYDVVLWPAAGEGGYPQDVPVEVTFEACEESAESDPSDGSENP